MSEPKTISGYLAAVAEQIRWKRARPVVTSELQQHLEDQRDAFLSEGFDNAEQLAVEEMGDPVTVGTELDFIHRPKPQWGLLSLTILLALASVIFRVWLNAGSQNARPGQAILSLIVGCGALLAGYFMDYARLAHHGGKIYMAALAISVLGLFLSPIRNGVLYFVRCIALCYPVVYAFGLYACRGKGWWGLWLAVIGGAPLALLCLKAPYIFGLVSLLLTGFILLLMAAWHDWFGIGRRRSILFLSLCAAAVLCVSLCYLFLGLGVRSAYFVSRFNTALHPEQDPAGQGYAATAIRSAISASQWLGTGTSFSPLPYEQTVPNADTDNLLTTLIYKLGWLPFLVVILAFTVFMVCLLRRCLKHKSQLGRLVVLSVVVVLCLQALCSTAYNMGFTLIGGAAFPLVTGNLYTIINMGLIGLALSVFRGESIAREHSYTAKRPRYRIKIVIEKDLNILT